MRAFKAILRKVGTASYGFTVPKQYIKDESVTIDELYLVELKEVSNEKNSIKVKNS